MPAKTKKQHRAMAAAAAGKSTLGIPQSVGREFMGGGSKKYGGSTAGGASVGNPEYRHDDLKKGRNPQTRGTKKMGKETGHGSRNTQTPSNYYVQDGKMKMQRCQAIKLRSKKASGQSSSTFKGGNPHNPHRGAY